MKFGDMWIEMCEIGDKMCEYFLFMCEVPPYMCENPAIMCKIVNKYDSSSRIGPKSLHIEPLFTITGPECSEIGPLL